MKQLRKPLLINCMSIPIDIIHKLMYDMNVITTHYGERIYSQSKVPRGKKTEST